MDPGHDVHVGLRDARGKRLLGRMAGFWAGVVVAFLGADSPPLLILGLSVSLVCAIPVFATIYRSKPRGGW